MVTLGTALLLIGGVGWRALGLLQRILDRGEICATRIEALHKQDREWMETALKSIIAGQQQLAKDHERVMTELVGQRKSHHNDHQGIIIELTKLLVKFDEIIRKG